jgi:hypothetical protein
VFSEHSYLEYQDTLLNWSHRRIADVLSENNLLCVGFSGTDANFRFLCRTLLKIQRASTLGNHTDQKKVWLAKRCEGSFISDEDSPYAFACLQAHADSVSNYFRKQFGIQILWHKEFLDLAKRLEEIVQILKKK